MILRLYLATRCKNRGYIASREYIFRCQRPAVCDNDTNFLLLSTIRILLSVTTYHRHGLQTGRDDHLMLLNMPDVVLILIIQATPA